MYSGQFYVGTLPCKNNLKSVRVEERYKTHFQSFSFVRIKNKQTTDKVHQNIRNILSLLRQICLNLVQTLPFLQLCKVHDVTNTQYTLPRAFSQSKSSSETTESLKFNPWNFVLKCVNIFVPQRKELFCKIGMSKFEYCKRI